MISRHIKAADLFEKGDVLMKRKIALLLCAVMIMASFAVHGAGTEEEAKTLYDLGLLRGTGDTFDLHSLELSRNATRTEISITIVRMLGKEEKANYQQNPHPFSDVPSWAGNYIGWLYENYLVNGVSDTYFGANDTATVAQFVTMMLRVLGYDDSEGDFSYNSAASFAKSIGLIDASIASKNELSREDMVTICYNALSQNLKNSRRTLMDKLCDEGAVDENAAKSSGLL